jgi:hypothetical protein
VAPGLTPNLSDSATREANRVAMANAIATVGAAGGGVILIPAGHYYLQQRQVNGVWQDEGAIQIDRDNITLRGAGIGKTVLHSRSAYTVQNGRVMRGHTIWIVGGATSANRRVGTVIEQLELTADLGYTGNTGWPANTTTGDGWDITNKAIISSDSAGAPWVKDLTIRDVYCHGYRGEILFVGGSGVQNLTLERVWSRDTNASCFNMAANTLTVTDCQLGGNSTDSRFWVESWNGPFESQANWSNCTFSCPDHPSGGVGEANMQPSGAGTTLTYDGNRFIHCGAAFGFYGLLSVDWVIQNNYIESCSLAAIQASEVSWVGTNSNITFRRNTILNAQQLLSTSARTSNWLIDSNDFTGKANSYLLQNFGGTATNVVFSNNTRRNTSGESTGGTGGCTFTNNVVASPIVDTQAPTVPTGLTATPGCDASIWLMWTPSTDNRGVSGYKVYRNGTQVGTARHRWYMDRVGLANGTTYNYTVSAFDFAGNESIQSSSVQVTTGALSG